MKKRILCLLLCVATLASLLPALGAPLTLKAEAATTSQNNIVARADYMYDSTWVCKKTVNGWRNQYTFYAGNTYRMPYGQPVYAGKYIGYGVSVDDYLTAAANSGSVFYTSRSNYAERYSTYYATDCSAFVSWCWGISRQTTATIPNFSTYLGMTNTTNVYKLQLGDCLNSNSVGHVVLVTGLSYNSSGKISQIEITEQTPPQLKRSYYTPSQLSSKYGAYGIYRYNGTVPAAPGSSSDSSVSSGTTTTVTTQYYPKCGSSYTTFYAAMDSIGVSCDWSLHTRIAAINGITGFTGTAAQNTQLLNLLKAGKLLNPDYTGAASSVTTQYYPKCDSSYSTFYAAMDSIGVSCDWELHCRIAASNGITGFTGTAEQNTNLLNLLKAGKLINPDNGVSYYAKCDSSYTTFYAAMDSIGVSCDWELHCRIAAANGITGFTGTAEQNTNLLNLLKAGKLIIPSASSGGNTNSGGSTNTTVSKDLVIGVNEKYIGSGYEEKISSAFKAYMADAGYSFSIEYRTLGDSTTTAAQLGAIINAAGDIDFVLGAGANINTTAGVNILTKALLVDKYNSDGKRYGALLTDKLEAVLFYNFVTGNCYHIYDNACDTACNACGAKRTVSAHVYDNACDAICNVCGATRTVADHVYDNDNDAICNICKYERNIKTLESIVIGVNEHYIGAGYEEKIKAAFSSYLAQKGYAFNIEYRTLGDSETNATELGAIINTAGDIDFVLGAGLNIDTTAGVSIIKKARLLGDYNSDGNRYGAMLTEKLPTVLFYNFVTGNSYHLYNENGVCHICGATRDQFTGLTLENGGNVKFISGHDSSAPTPVISGGSSITFTADSDGKDEAWVIDLGDKKLNPNTSYTVTFSLYNAKGNVGVGCVRDEYLSGHEGINTFYGNFANPDVAAEKGYKIRVRRGFYEISDIVDGARTTFPYSNAYRDANGYVSLKMNVKYNGETYVCTLYYLNKSSNWVEIKKAYVGISSSNTFGLYILHGSTAGCVTAIKNIKYSIETRSTSYSSNVTTPTIKLIDYNVQTGNSYYTATANWLLKESPDIIGLQEVGPNWYKSLKSQLGGTYGYVGVPRSGTSSTNSGNEASPIFYKKSEYKLIDSGTKWLSNTPDTVGSKISGSLYIRVMTYAVLYHKDTGTIYIYVNTHLDNADSGSIRVKQMQILMNLVDKLPNYPTILTGDLNGGLQSGVINAIQNTHGYTNLAKKAAKKDSTYQTATFWETNSPCVIDYIFLSDMSKFNALSYKVGNSSSRCSVYKYSDHYALISTFNLK